jgi:mRNA interferase RelE/StbE
MYRLVLSDNARRIYEAAQAPLARKLARCFARIEAAPRRGNNVKSLKGPLAGHFRYRVGDYRIVYSVEDKTRTVCVVTIAHRRDAYD